MQLVADTHTHTYASGHAYSTILENARAAKSHGLQLFCTTDHAESMPGAPHPWFFANQRTLPRMLEGVALIRGVEANILNSRGEIDIDPQVEQHLDWIIASFHEPVFPSASRDDHTLALVNAIKSGRVDALGHLGNPRFDFDFEQVIRAAVEHHVAIEINNSSLSGHSRQGSVDRCYHIAMIAKDLGAYITTGSDAHFCQDIGMFSLTEALLDKVGIPPEQVITHNLDQFFQFLSLRGKTLANEFHFDSSELIKF